MVRPLAPANRPPTLFIVMAAASPTLPARALVRHVLVPLIAPAAIIGLALTPVSVFGCVNRGLMAVAVVLASTCAACVTLGIGARFQRREDPDASRWLLTTLILLMPIALLIGLG